MVIHTIIQERRKALGLTQEQVAEYLGITTPAVNKWEKGKNLPDMDILHRLSTIFSISIDDLYHAEDTLSVLNTPTQGI